MKEWMKKWKNGRKKWKNGRKNGGMEENMEEWKKN